MVPSIVSSQRKAEIVMSTAPPSMSTTEQTVRATAMLSRETYCLAALLSVRTVERSSLPSASARLARWTTKSARRFRD